MRVVSSNGCNKSRRHRRAPVQTAESNVEQIDLFGFTPTKFPNPLRFQPLPSDAVKALKAILTIRDLLPSNILDEPIEFNNREKDERPLTKQILRVTVFRIDNEDLQNIVPIESYSFMQSGEIHSTSSSSAVVSEDEFSEFLNDLLCYRDLDRVILATWGPSNLNTSLCWRHSVNDPNGLVPISDHSMLKHQRFEGSIALSIKPSPLLKITVHIMPAPHKELINFQLRTQEAISSLRNQPTSQPCQQMSDDETTLTDPELHWIQPTENRTEAEIPGKKTRDNADFIPPTVTPAKDVPTLATLENDFDSSYGRVRRRSRSFKMLFNRIRKLFLNRRDGLTRIQLERIFKEFEPRRIDEVLTRLLMKKMVTINATGRIRHRIHNVHPAPRSLRRLQIPVLGSA